MFSMHQLMEIRPATMEEVKLHRFQNDLRIIRKVTRGIN